MDDIHPTPSPATGVKFVYGDVFWENNMKIRKRKKKINVTEK